LSLVQRLIKEHLEEDRLIEEIKSLGNKEKFYEFSENLKNHIFIEEEILFPKLGFDPIVIELMHQHVAMWNLMSRIEESVEDEEYFNSLSLLSSLLKVHNAIEESNVYPELEKLKLKDINEKMPKGWVPKFMRENSLTF